MAEKRTNFWIPYQAHFYFIFIKSQKFLRLEIYYLLDHIPNNNSFYKHQILQIVSSSNEGNIGKKKTLQIIITHHIWYYRFFSLELKSIYEIIVLWIEDILIAFLNKKVRIVWVFHATIREPICIKYSSYIGTWTAKKGTF